ncbi:MAG: hypothetical protein LBL72_08610 [Candidatus Accumulibacter sp.]|nr:hypothetical protein [Accumulibacter sp.]
MNLVKLRASRRLFIASALVHLLAVFSVLVLPWPIWTRALLLALVGVSAFYAMRPPEIEEIVFSYADARMKVRIRGLDLLEASIGDGSTVFSGLIVLKLKFDDAQPRSVTLLPDQMSAEEFRRLNVWLRWNSSTALP